MRRWHALLFVVFYCGLLVSFKDANVHFTVYALQKRPNRGETDLVGKPGIAAIMNVLHDLGQDVSSEFVGFRNGLNIFHDKDTAGFNSREPKEESRRHVHC